MGNTFWAPLCFGTPVASMESFIVQTGIGQNIDIPCSIDHPFHLESERHQETHLQRHIFHARSARQTSLRRSSSHVSGFSCCFDGSHDEERLFVLSSLSRHHVGSIQFGTPMGGIEKWGMGCFFPQGRQNMAFDVQFRSVVEHYSL